MIAYGLLFCHGGEEDCGHCVGDSRRKQDQRKGHTGQDSVDRQGRTIIQPVKTEMTGDQYRFNTVKNVYKKPAAGKRKGKSKDFFHVRSRRAEISETVAGFPIIPEDHQQGEDHRDQFASYKTCHSQHRGNGQALFCQDQEEAVGDPDSGTLFQKLGGCRYGHLLFGIVVSVDTGVESSHRNGKGHEF